MAFGKPSEVKRVKNAVLEDQLNRTHIIKEESVNNNWKKKWSWILDEYDQLHKKIGELSKDSQFLSHVHMNAKEKDQRTIRPIPESTNHEYGWILSKPEFNLENFGPDHDIGAPLPPNYRILK